MKKIIFSIFSIVVAFSVSVAAYACGEMALENDSDVAVEDDETTTEETTTSESTSDSEETTSEEVEETTTEETTAETTTEETTEETTTKPPDVILETDPPENTDPEADTTTEEVTTTTAEETTTEEETVATVGDTTDSEPEDTTAASGSNPDIPGQISVDTNIIPQAPENSPQQNFTMTIVIIIAVFAALILSFVLPPLIKFIRNKIIYKYD